MAFTRHGRRRITFRHDGRQYEIHVARTAAKQAIDLEKARRLVRLDQHRSAPTAGTLSADVETYLRTLVHRPKLRQERAHHLAFWVDRFTDTPRGVLKPVDLSAALADLRQTKSASHCNHVRIALSHLFTTLDGKNGANPLRDVPRFAEPEPEPRGLPYDLIDRVFGYLTRQWGPQGAKRPQKTKARLKVMALTGWAPAQIMRIRPSDLRLEHAAVFLRRRLKGKGVAGSLKPVSPAATIALRQFVAADGFGAWSTSAANKAWKRACRKAMAHPETTPSEQDLLFRSHLYDLRHSFGTLVFQQTGNLHTTGELMDHHDAKTTRRYALAAIPAHLRAAVASLHAASPLAPASSAPLKLVQDK